MSEESKRFKKPTVDQVKEYLTEINCHTVDPEYFVDWYESKGWLVGKSPMKNWKAAVRTWTRLNNGKRTTYRNGIPL